jgi:CheY-like chemotaxis protein
MSVKLILIADDDADLCYVLALRCKHLGLEVFRSPDAMHALLGAHRVKPDLFLLDINMPGCNGLTACEMLSANRELCEIPVIMMSGRSDDDTLRRCKQLGARFVSKGPQLWEKLEPLIREALKLEPAAAPAPPPVDAKKVVGHAERPPSPKSRPKVLCVDDDPDVSQAIKVRLDGLGIEVLRAFSGMQGYWGCLDIKPDVVITDLTMPDGEGNYLLYRLKEHPLTKGIPVIVLTGQVNPAIRREMLSRGVDTYLKKPLVFEDLLEQLKRHIDFPPTQELAPR